MLGLIRKLRGNALETLNETFIVKLSRIKARFSRKSLAQLPPFSRQIPAPFELVLWDSFLEPTSLKLVVSNDVIYAMYALGVSDRHPNRWVARTLTDSTRLKVCVNSMARLN